MAKTIAELMHSLAREAGSLEYEVDALYEFGMLSRLLFNRYTEVHIIAKEISKNYIILSTSKGCKPENYKYLAFILSEANLFVLLCPPNNYVLAQDYGLSQNLQNIIKGLINLQIPSMKFDDQTKQIFNFIQQKGFLDFESLFIEDVQNPQKRGNITLQDLFLQDSSGKSLLNAINRIHRSLPTEGPEYKALSSFLNNLLHQDPYFSLSNFSCKLEELSHLLLTSSDVSNNKQLWNAFKAEFGFVNSVSEDLLHKSLIDVINSTAPENPSHYYTKRILKKKSSELSI